MATEVSICSSALLALGGKSITSFSDGTTNANLCLQFYPETRDELLRAHPWRFAIKRETLAQDATFTASWEWDYGFKFPTDSLRVLSTSIDPEAWQREGALIVCNASALSIKYIRRVTDVALFDVNFIVALEGALAMKLCKPVTGSLSALGNMAAIRDQGLKDARTYNGFEGTAEPLNTNDLIDCR